MEPLDDLRQKIAEHGWAVRHVVDPDPAQCLSYTVGLTAHLHPEVVMTGLPPDVAHTFLNSAGHVVVHEHGHFAGGERTTELADGPPFAVIDVTDTGIGLPEDRERLTEPYMTTRVRGTGLGLAIVKKIVEEHMGEIAFLDRQGGGTHVRIAFDADRLAALAGEDGAANDKDNDDVGEND